LSVSEEPRTDGPHDLADEDELWCVVANVKREHATGPHGQQVTSGTRQFRGGTKVYIAGCYPGTCDRIVVIGQHRKSRRFITCVLGVRHVENLRVKPVHHPQVRRLIEQDAKCWIGTKEQAEWWTDVFIQLQQEH
jgi:hypothetical protein